MLCLFGLSLLAIATTGGAVSVGSAVAPQAVDNVDNGGDDLCPYQADIFLLMDASSSIGPDHYQEMKDFLRGVISHFDVGHDKVRIGLITFNKGAKFEFYLNTYQNKIDILNAFDKIQDTAMGTATHRSMSMARQTGFTPENGDRPDVPNIAILITDGMSTHPDRTATEQALLKATGVRIFAIGIGWTDDAELHLIASDPQEKYFHYVKHFDGLEDILSEFQQTTCSEITRPPPVITQVPVTAAPTAAPTTAQATKKPFAGTTSFCPYAADIMFLIDASSSIGLIDYNQTKDFAKGVISHFTIGPNETRVGVITFNFGAKVEFLLNAYNTKAEILAAFDHLQDVQVGTATHRALKYAREQGFVVENGDRPELPNIAILITDGKSTHPNDTAVEQQLLKNTGARIFAIGIGWTDENELRLIASDPVDKYFHYVNNFDGLDDILNDFQATSCSEVTRPLPPTTPAPTTLAPTTTVEIICPYQADIMILMDASSSIGVTDYTLMKNFLKDVINHFDIGEDAVRVGVITFNFGAQFEFHLNEHYTKAEIFTALDNVQNIHVGTATHRALKYARETGFTAEHGDRAGVPNIALLITDGKSTHPNETALEQALLKQTGARIFAIGIGWTNKDELTMVASEPKEKYFHYVNDFDGLDDILSDFQQTACSEITRTDPPVVHGGIKTTATPAPTTSIPKELPKPSEVCLSTGDVVFLLDTSSSVGEDGLNRTKDFVISMLTEFHIGPDNVNVAVVTFDQWARIEFNLDKFYDFENMTNAVNEIVRIAVGTSTERGLEMVRTQVFNTSSDRPDVGNLAIVVTDGRSRRPDDTEREAIALKDAGTTVFCIGVGWVDLGEISIISSDPDSDFAFHIDDYDALSAIIDAVLDKTCDYCHAADLIIVMDASSSIGVDDYEKMKVFVKELLEYFLVGEERVRVGLITFNQFPLIEFNLNIYYNHSAMYTAIDNAKAVAVGTWTDRAIKVARETMLTEINGARSGSPDVMIVITDGFSREPNQTVIEAQLCKDQNVTMFSIGIGKWISYDELLAIASDEEYVFMVDDFDGLGAIEDLLQEEICNATATPWPIATATSGCNIEADIMLVFDSSSHISDKDFKRAKELASNIVKDLRVGNNKARIGAMKFNDDSILEFPLNFSYDKTDIIDAIRDMQHTGTGSRAEKSLYELRTVAFRECLGGRASVPDIAIFFTDGKFDNPILVSAETNLAAGEGIRVFGIGIGDDVNAPGVSLLSPTYTNKYSYAGATHEELGRVQSSILTGICRAYSPCD